MQAVRMVLPVALLERGVLVPPPVWAVPTNRFGNIFRQAGA